MMSYPLNNECHPSFFESLSKFFHEDAAPLPYDLRGIMIQITSGLYLNGNSGVYPDASSRVIYTVADFVRINGEDQLHKLTRLIQRGYVDQTADGILLPVRYCDGSPRPWAPPPAVDRNADH